MMKKLIIESKIGNIRIVENFIDNFTADAGIKKESYGKIIVATLEAVNNAIVHGNKSDIAKNVIIELKYDAASVTIQVTDEGKGFIPSNVPDPTLPENIESVNGRGVFLMSHLSDEISYNDNGNSVTMKFKIV